MDPDWFKDIACRLAAGERVPRVAIEEFEQHIRSKQQSKEKFELELAVEEDRRLAQLSTFRPPAEVVSIALTYNKSTSFDVSTFQDWLADIAMYTGPDHTPPQFYRAERAALFDIKNALVQLEAGFEALAVSHRKPRALSELYRAYDAQVAQLVRQLERRPSMRGKLSMSPEMGMIAWDWPLQMHFMSRAIERRLKCLAQGLRRGQPRSDYWKQTAAFEVAFALYRARWHTGSNQPIPNGRDGSDRAVEYLLQQLFNKLLGENLAPATVAKFAAKGIATLRKLEAAQFDEFAIPEPHGSIVARAYAPVHRWAIEREFPWAVNAGTGGVPEGEISSRERWEARANDLRHAFLSRIGVWRLGSDRWRDEK